ncbi:unnamed protein product [Cuscuta epithymum]|uniref:Uncharacterized protein n=1 Tax=Cuscuta epithymum TaxID=186058 RepID=A0AAV0CCH1_9ASTE|nr:unnamed protein product [Cuscuta epithymum]
MAKITSDTVGCVFAELYYTHLHIKPEGSCGFYTKSSLATWDSQKCITTLEGIHEMIMTSDFKDCFFEIEDIRTQDCLQGTIPVVVTGVSIGKEKLRRKFSQTFILAKNETSFLRFKRYSSFQPATKEVDNVNDVADVAMAPESTMEVVDLEMQPTPEPVLLEVVPHVQVEEKVVSEVSSDVKEAVPKVMETVSEKVVKVDELKVDDAASEDKSTMSEEVKDAAPKSSYSEMVSKNKMGSTPTPVTQYVRVSALDGLTEEEKTKITGLRNGSIKPMAPASVKKPETPPSNNSPPMDKNTGPKGIYVGGLPPDTTKADLAGVVKVFGRVKKYDSVQVIRSDGDYCFGFVHFQSVDSAKKAVETKVIKVKGKDAYISYKRTGRRASYGNDNRGRSPFGIGGSHSTTPSSRAPSCNSQLSGSHNSETRHVNQQKNGETRQVNQHNNGEALHVKQHNNGEALHVNQHSNGESAHIDQHSNGEIIGADGDEEGWIVAKRRQRGRNDNNVNERNNGQRLQNGKTYSRHAIESDRRMRNGEREEQRRRNGGVHDQKRSSS